MYREEGGGGIDETHDPFVGDESLFQKREVELQKRMTRRDGSTMSLAQSKRASEVQKDINAWEENRLFTSGVVRAREVHGDLAALPAALTYTACSRSHWIDVTSAPS